jgi:hypothetical protein
VSPALPREERDAIRARAEAATPGPWDWYGYGETGRTLYLDNSPYHDLNVLKTTDDWPPTDADAEFIAHARSDVPALLDALDAAEAEIERLRATYGLDRDDKHPCIRVEAYLRLEAERDAARAEAVALRTQYRDLATYRTTHANLGLCPESPNDKARDPDCPVCRALAAHESGIRGRERAAFAALLDAEDDEDERTGR